MGTGLSFRHNGSIDVLEWDGRINSDSLGSVDNGTLTIAGGELVITNTSVTINNNLTAKKIYLTNSSQQIFFDSNSETYTILEDGATGSAKTLRLPNVTGTIAHIADATQTFAGGLTFTRGATFNGNLTMGNGINIVLGTSTGTKIGTATNQKLGFFNATPVVQPAGNAVEFNSVSSDINNLTSTDLDFTCSGVTVVPISGATAWGYSSEAEAQSIEDQLNNAVTDVQNVITQYQALRDDVEQTKKNLNRCFQILGWLGFKATDVVP